MEIRRLRVLALEVFCFGNKLKPVLNLFLDVRVTLIPIRNSVTFGDKNVRVLGPHI